LRQRVLRPQLTGDPLGSAVQTHSYILRTTSGASLSNRAPSLALGLVLAGPNTHSQSQDPAEILRSARSLRCAFPSGGSEVLTDAKPRYQPAQGADGVFDDIDRGKGMARVIGRVGAGNVRVIASSETLTFIEISSVGYPQMTAVFGAFRPHTMELVASDSRHAMVAGRVLVEQYYGSCRVLQ